MIKQALQTVLLFIAVITLVVILCITITFTQKQETNKIWNNGICSQCNGKYELVNVSKTQGTVHYYYTCEDCKNLIDIKNIYKK